MTLTAPDQAAERRDALVGRLFEATLGAFDLLAIHLGDRLGLYQALAERGPLTAAGARRRGRHRPALCARVARAPGRRRDPRRRRRRRGARRAPLRAAGGPRRGPRRPDQPSTMAPMAQWVVAGGKSMDDLVDAYRTGGGVPWDRYQDVVTAQDRTTARRSRTS